MTFAFLSKPQVFEQSLFLFSVESGNPSQNFVRLVQRFLNDDHDTDGFRLFQAVSFLGVYFRGNMLGTFFVWLPDLAIHRNFCDFRVLTATFF